MNIEGKAIVSVHTPPTTAAAHHPYSEMISEGPIMKRFVGFLHIFVLQRVLEWSWRSTAALIGKMLRNRIMSIACEGQSVAVVMVLD